MGSGPLPGNGGNALHAVVAVLTLAAVVGSLGLDIYRTTYPSAERLAGMVQTSVNDYLRSDADLREYSPEVGDISVMRVEENAFDGQAEVKTNSGRSRFVSVHVH